MLQVCSHAACQYRPHLADNASFIMRWFLLSLSGQFQLYSSAPARGLALRSFATQVGSGTAVIITSSNSPTAHSHNRGNNGPLLFPQLLIQAHKAHEIEVGHWSHCKRASWTARLTNFGRIVEISHREWTWLQNSAYSTILIACGVTLTMKFESAKKKRKETDEKNPVVDLKAVAAVPTPGLAGTCAGAWARNRAVQARKYKLNRNNCTRKRAM